MEELRYPIGRFTLPDLPLTEDERRSAIAAIADTPAKLRIAIEGLSDAQLDTPYRPDGWTVRQVVHHVPDSHVNAYVRFKLALTEEVPTIRTYEEARWAELPDSGASIDFSLALLTAVHERWVYLLRRLDNSAWTRRFDHPEIGEMRVDQLLAMYAWHGPHHIAHITALRERELW